MSWNSQLQCKEEAPEQATPLASDLRVSKGAAFTSATMAQLKAEEELLATKVQLHQLLLQEYTADLEAVRRIIVERTPICEECGSDEVCWCPLNPPTTMSVSQPATPSPRSSKHLAKSTSTVPSPLKQPKCEAATVDVGR